MSNLKLGLRPFVPRLTDLQFGKYRTGAPLPKHPATFGHEGLIKSWGMFGNDQYGDCALAGAAHETMLFSAIGGKPADFTTENVLSDYSAITGFNKNDPNSDQGTDAHDLADYRKKTGLIDVSGNRHKIASYLFTDPKNLDQTLEAIWLFGAVGWCIAVPQSAMDQFDKGQPWHVVPGWDWHGRQILGYHYIPLVANRATLAAVTWGKVQGATVDFFRRYTQAVVVWLSPEILNGGHSLEGFDLAALTKDLGSMT